MYGLTNKHLCPFCFHDLMELGGDTLECVECGHRFFNDTELY